MSYSKARLIEEYMDDMSGKRSWMRTALYQLTKSMKVDMCLYVPHNIFLRAEVLCEDIKDHTGKNFTQSDLLNLLYDDFLTYIQLNPNPKIIFAKLQEIKMNSGKEMAIVKEEMNSAVFKSVSSKKGKNEKARIFGSFRRKTALRGEIMLSDLEGVYPNHGYMLENVLEYLYCDFINSFRQNDKTEVMNQIISFVDGEE